MVVVSVTKLCNEEVTPESLSRSLLCFRCWLAGSLMPWKPEVLIGKTNN